ncbi:MAG TPA: hypothetical protein VFS39_16475, partial [Nitrospira sp.]|nr:hypothetical protein [Nitrospira sp.]
TPPPLQTQISADGATYQFPVAAPPGGSITFHVESEQVGRLPASIGASPGQALSFTQWIHP